MGPRKAQRTPNGPTEEKVGRAAKAMPNPNWRRKAQWTPSNLTLGQKNPWAGAIGGRTSTGGVFFSAGCFK